MRVCIITSWFPTAENPSLGSFVYNFAKHLGKSGISVSVISILGNRDKLIQSQDSMTIYRIIPKKIAVFSILRLTKKIKPDIIHVHAPNIFSSNAIIVGKLLKIPLIATVHRAEIEPIDKPVLFFLRRFVLRRFKRIVAVSNFSKSLALKAGSEGSKLSVIYNSCDETRFFGRNQLMARMELALPSEKKIILFVGNLTRRKGIRTLVNSLSLVHDIFPDFLVIIIGKGEEEEELKNEINRHDLDRCIELRGWCSDEQLPYYYSAADIFVLPSTMEGHSVALLEAMASGLPIVASDIEGNRESVEDGVNGLLFEINNEKMLAEKLMIMLYDDKLRDRISNKNLNAYLERFSMGAHIEKYIKIYRSLVEDKSRTLAR